MRDSLKGVSLRSISLAGLLLLGTASCSQGIQPGLTVAAASSLAPVLAAWEENLPADQPDTTLVFGASVDLAEQIRSGAPVDLFLSADPDLVDALHAEGLLSDPPVILAQGTLSIVLAEEMRGLGPPDLALLASPQVRQVVLADPDHAPFGAAARQALQHAGLWDEVQDKLVFSGSALQALEVVQTGNAQAGLLPGSLLTHSELESAPVPLDLYTPPQYAAAIPKGGNPAHALAFLDRLMSPAGRAVMVANGLTPVTSR